MSALSITTFEVLSPELFLEIFRFLNGYDIYRTFYGLNRRLSTLVLTYGIKYIDLREKTLADSRKFLSDINSSRLNILKLSSKYNDEQIDQILINNHFRLSNLNHIRSLTLDSVGVFTIHSIINQRLNFPDLETLIIRFRSDLCQEKLRDTYKFILNYISVRFKSLKFLNLSILDVNKPFTDEDGIFLHLSSTFTEIYPSLQYLYIDNIIIDNIERIFSCFPNLYKLNANITLDRFISDYSILSNLSFCKLEIISSEFQFTLHLLKQCLNLKKLILDINSANADELDSTQWEDLIENYLTNLKHFQVNMSFIDITMSLIQDLFINNFIQNKFWIERKTVMNIAEQLTAYSDISVEIMIKFTI